MNNTIDLWLDSIEAKEYSNNFAFLILESEYSKNKIDIFKNINKTNKYFINYFNISNFTTKKQFLEQLKYIIKTKRTIFQKKHIIYIDEIHLIGLLERGILTDIINIIKDMALNLKKNKIKIVPIILTCNKNYLKRKTELEKLCIIYSENNNLIKNIVKIFPDISTDILMYIEDTFITEYQINKFILELENLTEPVNLNIEVIDKIYNKINNEIENHKTMQLYDSCTKILTEDITIKDTLFLYNQYKTILPLLIYDNIENYIKMYITPTEQDEIRMNIFLELTTAYELETLIYNKGKTHLNEIYSYKSCFKPGYILKLNSLKNKSPPIINYSLLLNKNSLQFIYRHKYQEKLLMANLTSEIYFNKDKIKQIVYSNNSDEYYLTKYNWSVKDLIILKKIL